MSDSRGVLAAPRTTLARSGDPARDRRSLMEVIVAERATTVVVGLPLSLDGTRGRAALDAEEEAESLRTLLIPEGVTVELFDERLTTVSAHQALAAAGMSSKARRTVVDQSAAAVMLQAWLDGQQAQHVPQQSARGRRSN